MGVHYAEIDARGICFHLTAQELLLSDTILRTERSDVLGMRYEGGEWHEVDEGLPAPSQLDRIEESLSQLSAESITEEKLSAAIAEGVNEI